MEHCHLRVKDLERGEIMARDGKGQKDRIAMLPRRLVEALRLHLADVRAQDTGNLEQGAGTVELPGALDRKLPMLRANGPGNGSFPPAAMTTTSPPAPGAATTFTKPALQRAVHGACLAAGLSKRASCHTLPPWLCHDPLEAGYDIRIIQELLGHSDVATTMVYTHVLNRGGHGVCSPLDGMVPPPRAPRRPATPDTRPCERSPAVDLDLGSRVFDC